MLFWCRCKGSRPVSVCASHLDGSEANGSGGPHPLNVAGAFGHGTSTRQHRDAATHVAGELLFSKVASQPAGFGETCHRSSEDQLANPCFFCAVVPSILPACAWATAFLDAYVCNDMLIHH